MATIKLYGLIYGLSTIHRSMRLGHFDSALHVLGKDAKQIRLDRLDGRVFTGSHGGDSSSVSSSPDPSWVTTA